MAYEQHIQESMAQFGSDGEGLLKQKSKSIPAGTTDSESTNGCFDCNICLDSAHDPVVTLCGHLYCWPCIYKWLNVETSPFEPDENPRCPVCKAKISESSLVPLYGRGLPTSESDAKKLELNIVLPRRPNFTTNPNQRIPSYPFQSQPQPLHHHQYFPPNPYANYAPMATANNFSPTAAIVGEMVFTRMFGNTDMGLLPYPYSNAAPLIGNGSPRMRRQEMEVDKSLNRISEWMSSKGLCPFSPGDRAVQLDLIGRVRGLDAGESYFDMLNEHEKIDKMYGALLNCYVREGLVDKSTSHMQKMKEMGFASSTLSYNDLMCLYTHTGQLEKIPDVLAEARALLQEWESSCQFYDFRVPNILIIGYCRKGLIEKAEALLQEIMGKGKFPIPNSWAIIAAAYLDKGNMEKTFECMTNALEVKEENPDWRPKLLVISSVLNWLKDRGEVEKAEAFVSSLKTVAGIDLEIL